MNVARCASCTWTAPAPSVKAAAAELWHHDEVEHRGLGDIHQMPNVDWHSRALRAVLELAAKGEPFVISQVIHLGVPDAPNPRTDWARIQKEAEDMGWIRQTGRLGRSVRPTAKK